MIAISQFTGSEGASEEDLKGNGPHSQAGEPSPLLTIGEASRAFNAHPNTLREWASRGLIETLRTPGGHRRIVESSVLALLRSKGIVKREDVHVDDGAIEEPKTEGGQVVLLLARVSSNAQAKGTDGQGNQLDDKSSSDLQRQISRLREYSKEKFGVDGVLFSDKASGLNYQRPNFLKMLRGILSHKYDGAKLLICWKERAMRFAFEMFEEVCNAHNIEIIIIEDQPDKSYETELAEDLLAITHLFSCRLYSKRSSLTNKRQFDADTALEILSLSKQNLPIEECLRRLQGRTDHRGRPITRWVFERFVRESGLLDKVAGGEPEQNSFQKWADAYLVRVEPRNDPRTGKAAKDTRLLKSAIVKHYGEWCSKMKLPPVNAKTVGQFMRELGYEKTLTADSKTVFKEVQIRA